MQSSSGYSHSYFVPSGTDGLFVLCSVEGVIWGPAFCSSRIQLIFFYIEHILIKSYLLFWVCTDVKF